MTADLVTAARQYETGDAALIQLLGALADEIARLRAWRARMIAIPSPSSICGLLGCQNLRFHVHDIEQDDVMAPREMCPRCEKYPKGLDHICTGDRP